ncbi:hypothetical protein D3C77_509580 [compost metagenome]
MVFRIEVLQAPENHPDQTERRHAKKSGLPPPYGENQWQQHWREHRPHVSSGIEYASGHCALACREPQARGFDARGVVGRLGQAKNESADHEPCR